MLPSIILIMKSNHGMNIKTRVIQSNSLSFDIKTIILRASQQIIMSYQNNIAKESLSLQNHIVKPCFIFITQNTPIMHNPDDEPSNWFILFNALQLFQLLRNT